MEIRLHDDIAAFAALTAPLFNADPVRHTVVITVLAGRLRPDGPDDLVTMLTVHDGGGLRGAALRVRHWSLITSALPPDSAPAVAELLAGSDEPPVGVVGPTANAEAFAVAWFERTGATARVVMSQRLFVLGELRPPDGVPGAARVAGTGDIPLLARWLKAFAAAALPSGWPHRDDPEAAIARQLAAGHGNLLWEVGGEPVAMATASAPTAGMSKIAPVWTPPEHRCRGFGSAVTAAASRWAQDRGAVHVVLFTDLSNPVSNSIYPKIGYLPVHDAVDLAFERHVSGT